MSPRTLAYIQDAPARPLDFVALAALSDAFFVRIMHARGTLQPMATVSLTTYFHVGAEELAAMGATPLIGEADAAIFHNGFADQTCALWTLGRPPHRQRGADHLVQGINSSVIALGVAASPRNCNWLGRESAHRRKSLRLFGGCRLCRDGNRFPCV